MGNTAGFCAVGLVVVCIIELIRRFWSKISPKSNNIINGFMLPPGSMGLPFIGVTLHLLAPSYSIDLHPFIKSRIQRYGPIFRTSIVGHPIVVSADAEINNYILQQEGNLVELWYLGTFSKILETKDPETKMNSLGDIHKYIRNTLLKQFGAESLKTKLLPQLDEFINKSLNAWSSQPSVEVKEALLVMLINFSAKKMIGYDAEKSSENLSELFTGILEALISFPLNIPGTTYNKCVKDKEKVATILRNMLKQRCTSVSHETYEGDALDQIINDMRVKKFLSEDFIVNLLFVILLASAESISITLSLLLKLVLEHPSVIQDLTSEHEEIIHNRKNPNSALTWDEYKSMTFTHQVINETARLANGAPGLLRRAVKDIIVKGVIIPSGWTIMLVTAHQHLNSNTFLDPLNFNPWRWKDLDSDSISKNFMPFGRGFRQCPGAEYTRAFMATFLHILVTKYRFTKIKGGEIARNPILGFGQKGIHINFSKK